MPLKVDYVCGPCNQKRGMALDLKELVLAHRAGISAKPHQVSIEEIGQTPQTIPQGFNLGQYIEAIETAITTKALEENRHNVTRTAKALGITFRAMRYRMERLGIKR
jgi:two-component system response regulator PilR (NtrC family)